MVERQDNKPVTTRERVFDENVREWPVGTVDKSEAFANGNRVEVVKKHPDLAPAYGTIAAARKFAEKKFQDNKEDQARFVALAQQIVAEKIAHGEPVPAPKIRETKVQERPKQQGDDQERGTHPQKQQHADHERTR